MKRAKKSSKAAAVGRSGRTGCSAPIRFYWKQCYEIGDDVHWALCDTDTDIRSHGCVSSFYTILEAKSKLGVDGRPVEQQEILALIAKLLTDHYSKPNPTGQASDHKNGG